MSSPLLLSALAGLGDLEGYGHVYIGPFNPMLCGAAALLAQHWEAGLASPGCLDAERPNLPPITPPTRVLFAVLRYFGWAHVGVVSGGGRAGRCRAEPRWWRSERVCV